MDPATPKEDPIQLSPFTVHAEAHKGYVAQETLAGTRLRTPIADTPVALSVMTSDLLDDLGATDFRDVVDFVPSTQYYFTTTNDPTGNGAKQPTNIVVRGFATSTQTRDFFLTQTAADRYLTSEFTFTRGPNALLFGIGNPGGIVAVQTNRAQFNGAPGSLTLLYDRYHSKRASLDQNFELIKNRVAVRADFLVERKHGFRVPTEQNKDGAFVTTTIRPFKNSTATTVVFSYEYGRRDDVSPRPFAPFDGFSTWVANGAPLYDNFAQPRPPTALSASTPFSRVENNYVHVLHQNFVAPYLTSIGQRIGGLPYNSFVQSNGRIINGNIVAPAQGGGDSISQDFVSLNPLDVLRNHFGGDQARLNAWLAGLGSARAIPESFANGACVVIPMTTFLSGKQDRIVQRWNVPRLIVDQRIGRNLDVEVAANTERFNSFNRVMLRGTDYFLRYDPNLYLPNGAPNPFAGVPYVSNEAFATLDRQRTSTDEGRAIASYRLDLNERRLFRVPLGRYTLSALGNWYRTDTRNSQQRPYVTHVNGAPLANVAQNSGIVHSRYYFLPGEPIHLVDEFVPLPANSFYQGDWINFSGSRTVRRVDSYAAALQGYLFKDRLVLLGGARSDRARTWTTTTVNYNTDTAAQAGRYPGEVNLTETNKTLAPIDDDKVTNYSAGVVYHLIKAFSPFYNYSTNSNPSGTNRDVYHNLIPGLRGVGRDYGFKFSLFDGRLQGAYTHYKTEQQNVTGSTPGGADTLFALMNTNLQLAEPDIYAERQRIGLTWAVHWDQITTGDELQLTFNPTKNLRLRIAASRQETTTSGRYEDVARFLAEHVPVWQAYATRAGTPAASSQTVLNSLPNIDAQLDSFLSINGSPLVGESDYSASLSASYAFDEIRWLRGFRLGASVSYRGPVLLGYQVDRDGTAVLSNEYRGSGPKYLNLQASYTRKVGRRYVWSATFQVDNVLDDDDPVARKATWDYTVNQFFVTSNTMRPPRSWSVTTKIAW